MFLGCYYFYDDFENMCIFLFNRIIIINRRYESLVIVYGWFMKQWFALYALPCSYWNRCFNSLRPRQNGRLFADDTFKRIFFNENIRISTKNSLKFVPKGLINNIPSLVLIMAWRRPGDKPLSEPMLVRSLTHICVTRPQWVNAWPRYYFKR